MSMKVPSERSDPSTQFLSNLDHLESIKDKAHLYKFAHGRIQERAGLDKLIKSISYTIASPSAQRIKGDVLTNQLAMKVIDHFADELAGLNPNQKSDHVIAFITDKVTSKLTLPQAQLVRSAVGFVQMSKSNIHSEIDDSGHLTLTQFDTGDKIRNKLYSTASSRVDSAEKQVKLNETLLVTQKRDLENVQNLYAKLKNSDNPLEIDKLTIALYSNESALPILAKFAEKTQNQDGHEFIKAVLDLRATPLDGREEKINSMMEKFIIQDEYNPDNPFGDVDDTRMPVELGSIIRDPLIEKYESAKNGEVESYTQKITSQGSYINRENSTYVPLGAEKVKMSASDFDEAFTNVIGKLAHTIRKEPDDTIGNELQAMLEDLK